MVFTSLAKTFGRTSSTLSLLHLLPPPWFLSSLLFLLPVRVKLVNVNRFSSPCLYLFFTQPRPPLQMSLFRISSLISLFDSLSSTAQGLKVTLPSHPFDFNLLSLVNHLSTNQIIQELSTKWTRLSLTDLR